MDPKIGVGELSIAHNKLQSSHFLEKRTAIFGISHLRVTCILEKSFDIEDPVVLRFLGGFRITAAVPHRCA